MCPRIPIVGRGTGCELRRINPLRILQYYEDGVFLVMACHGEIWLRLSVIGSKCELHPNKQHRTTHYPSDDATTKKSKFKWHIESGVTRAGVFAVSRRKHRTIRRNIYSACAESMTWIEWTEMACRRIRESVRMPRIFQLIANEPAYSILALLMFSCTFATYTQRIATYTNHPHTKRHSATSNRRHGAQIITCTIF